MPKAEVPTMKHKADAKIRIGPSGILFFERISGLNVLMDEIQAPMSAWAAAPRQISIALANDCDLTCPYCFASKSRAKLEMQQVTDWLRELDANGTISVGFGGGEPTLYPSFVELCRWVVQNTGLAVTFTSHGHHLDDRLLDGLRGNVHFVRISMDGVGRTYETLRKRPFAFLCERISTLQSIARFGINFVVNATTFPDLPAATTLAAELGASEFLLLPQQPARGKPGIDPTTRQALCEWVKSYTGSVRLAISEIAAEGFPTCDPFSAEIGLAAYAHIDAHGILKRTSFDREGVKIGGAGIIEGLRQLHKNDKKIP